MSDRGALPLGERLEVEAALGGAFEPLREARTGLSPLRVRAAVRWGRGAPAATPAAPGAPAALAWSGAIARLSELSVAVGMSVLIFTAALGTAVPGGTTVDPTQAPTPEAVITASLAAQEREIRAVRLEWLRSLRLDAVRIDGYVPVQDWLDPTAVRPARSQRLVLPAPYPY